MDTEISLRDAVPGDIEAIRALADRTWRACYPGIISLEQIDYMLGWMYAAETIREEMAAGVARYLLAVAPPGLASGFAAYGPGEKAGEVFLHKLYVVPERQRQGLGSALLAEVSRRAAAAGARSLVLRVNRNNLPAIRAYQARGFHLAGELRSDIGGGFAMDDHLMTKMLHP